MTNHIIVLKCLKKSESILFILKNFGGSLAHNWYKSKPIEFSGGLEKSYILSKLCHISHIHIFFMCCFIFFVSNPQIVQINMILPDNYNQQAGAELCQAKHSLS